ncbi:class I SAM-dependent methyltransferase [Candidatus Parcubacteria bacterium]|nr:class I SAM-dependent methyltransferase [Candidatus Parcubacteria bacterium]
MSDTKIATEIEHGKFIAQKGEEIWNWSSPAGIVRWQRRIEMFKSFIGNKNRKVLEVGCGTGLFTKEIAETKNKIIAIDISHELLNIARKKIQKNNLTFLLSNAYKTEFSENTFDFIIGSSVLHHLNVDLALKEFYRILKPGGKIMFTEPNMLNPQIAIQKNIPFIKKMVGDSPDETAFVKWKIKNKLKKEGFNNISVNTFDFLHPFIPGFIIKFVQPIFNFCEKLPLIKEIAGSLVITASKEIK